MYRAPTGEVGNGSEPGRMAAPPGKAGPGDGKDNTNSRAFIRAKGAGFRGVSLSRPAAAQ